MPVDFPTGRGRRKARFITAEMYFCLWLVITGLQGAFLHDRDMFAVHTAQNCDFIPIFEKIRGAFNREKKDGDKK